MRKAPAPKRVTKKIPRSFNPGLDRHPYTDLHGMRWTRDRKGDWWLTADIAPRFFNPNRVLHGGVMFTLADTAMGRLVTSFLEPGEECASVEVKIHNLRMVNGGRLRAQAQFVHRGRRIAVVEAVVLDEKKRLVSKATGTMYVMSGRPRPPAR